MTKKLPTTKVQCPFCNGKAELEDKYNVGVNWRVQCENRWLPEKCTMNMRTHNCCTPEEAIKLWEKRA